VWHRAGPVVWLGSDGAMLCEKYHCTMSEESCAARYRMMNKSGPVKYERDPGCVGCLVGEEILKKQNGGAGMKECTNCGFKVEEANAEDYFYKSKRTKDGFEKNCKECKVALAKERRRAKKSKPKKNQGQAATLPPDQQVEEVVTTQISPKEEQRIQSIRAVAASSEISEEDVSKNFFKQKNNNLFDMDEMVKQIFTTAGYSNLLDGLKQAAFLDMRPMYMEVIFLVLCQLEDRGIEK
jgi:hypothetical protein